MGVRAYLARNARTPHVAGLLVAATAAGFTMLWLLYFSATNGFGGAPSERLFYVAFFLLVTPPNAYLVTRLAWRRWIAGRPFFGPRRAAAVGTAIGLLSYLTLAIAFSAAGQAASSLTDPGTSVSLLAIPGFVYRVVVFGLMGALIGVGLTAGIPVVLSVGVALLLARLDREDPARDGGGGRRSTPREHVRPPR